MKGLRPLQLVVVLVALALAVAAPYPAGAAAVAIAPPDTTVSVGDDFWIRVEADAFPDLKGYQLVFAFDPTVLQLLGAQAGDVLGPGGTYFGTLVPDVSAPPDSAWYDAAKLVGATAGPGVLVYFRFKALVVGESPLDCRHVDYRDSNNAQTLPGCSGGRVRVVGVVGARPSTWGRVKTRFR